MKEGRVEQLQKIRELDINDTLLSSVDTVDVQMILSYFYRYHAKDIYVQHYVQEDNGLFKWNSELIAYVQLNSDYVERKMNPNSKNSVYCKQVCPS